MSAELNYQGTSFASVPTHAGRFGRAWSVPLIAPEDRPVPDYRGTVACWMLDVPGAHPLWNMYSLCVLHLRAIEGVRPAIVRVAGATHELMILALDPERALPSLEALGRCEAPLRWLSPIDVMQQFIVKNDAQAERVGELAVRAIVAGVLSPDQDHRRAWEIAVRETAAHVLDGTHPMPEVM